MELRVAAKARFQRGVKHLQPLARAIEREKFFHSLAVAEIHQRQSRLLFEQAAQTRRAQAGAAGKFVQSKFVALVTNKSRGFFDGWVNIMHRHVGGAFKIMPRGEQRVTQSGIEETRMVARGGDFGEQGFEPCKHRLRQTAAVFAGWIRPLQNCRVRVGGDPADGLRPGDTDPHFEVGRLFDEDVFLRGKQPEQIATADLVFAVGEQVEAAALRDEIELQFRVTMHRVGATVVTVMPEIAVQLGGQFELLEHGDKK